MVLTLAEYTIVPPVLTTSSTAFQTCSSSAPPSNGDTLAGRTIADVRGPDLIGPRDGQIAQHAAARKRIVQMQLVDAAYQQQIRFRDRTRLEVHTAAADLEDLRLRANRQLMLGIDDRFALSNPASVSAFSKKSFSSANSRILAFSTGTSTLAAAGSSLASPNKTADVSPRHGRYCFQNLSGILEVGPTLLDIGNEVRSTALQGIPQGTFELVSPQVWEEASDGVLHSFDERCGKDGGTWPAADLALAKAWPAPTARCGERGVPAGELPDCPAHFPELRRLTASLDRPTWAAYLWAREIPSMQWHPVTLHFSSKPLWRRRFRAWRL